MAVDFNHTIVWAKDSKASAAFLAEILGLPEPILEKVYQGNAVRWLGLKA